MPLLGVEELDIEKRIRLDGEIVCRMVIDNHV